MQGDFMSFVWKNEYAIGVLIIDEQHKMLIEILNQLLELRDNKNESPKALGSILKSLEHYTNVHFTTEEEIMRIYNYENVQSHKKMHADFIKKISSLVKDYEDQEFFPMDVVYTYLENWLMKHILIEDKKMGPYLNAKGLK